MSTIGASVLTHGDILLNVFEYLPVKDIGRCAQVCRFWNSTAKEPRLWSGTNGMNEIIANARNNKENTP